VTLTQSCDVFVAVQDAGLDRLVRHVFRQRPSLVNYASAGLARQPERLCRPVDAHPIAAIRGNPSVTVLPPLPVALTNGTYAIDYSFQLTAAELDVHPGNVFTLPAELSPPLREQRLAVHAGACFGFGCPPQEIVDRLPPPGGEDGPPREPAVIPFRDLLCTCVDIFAVLGADLVGPRGNQHVAGRFDGLEIVDLGPTELEDSLECYVGLVVKLGLLPRLRVPAIALPPLPVGELFTIDVEPTPSSTVPNNPALEENQLKIFLDVTTGPGEPPGPPTPPPGPPGPKPPPRGNPRARIRTGAFDATAAVSEKFVQKVFDAVRTNFRLQTSGAKDFGAFSLSYDVDAHLENGTLDLRDDGTIRLSELDLAFDTLRACLGVNIPEICLGGFCIIPNPFGGCLVRAPKICAFSKDPDINLCLDIGPFVRAELSATLRPIIVYSVNPGRTPGMNDWDAFDAGVQNAWQLFVDPSGVDLDLFDIADIVGDLLDDALDAAIDILLGPLPGWFKDLVRALLGPVVDLVRAILDFGDDFSAWLADTLGFNLNLFDAITNALVDFLAKGTPLFNLFEPVGIKDTSDLVPILIPIESLSIEVTGAELVLGADIGA
jgi:hypothetical protein